MKKPQKVDLKNINFLKGGLNMKKILYLSNIEVPYRTAFFNELSKHCELTVLYERESSSNRDNTWTKSVKRNYNVKYLGGINIGNENAFSLKILKYVFSKYDSIVIGCYNSPVAMFAILFMKLMRKPYILNLDGEPFLKGKGFKNKIKHFFLKGARKYLTAGEKSAQSIESVSKNRPVIPYYFSSLSQEELNQNSKDISERNKNVLVIGQYFDYKGMDIALKAALQTPEIQYKFVGMGKRTELFLNEHHCEDAENIEFIPFLQKADLCNEYRDCAMLVLPSRQECWGLVINEAASFGTPIVSTKGSGAAVEFLQDDFPQYLAEPNNADDLCRCIQLLFTNENTADYSEFLIKKSALYSIENSVKAHLNAFEIEIEE